MINKQTGIFVQAFRENSFGVSGFVLRVIFLLVFMMPLSGHAQAQSGQVNPQPSASKDIEISDFTFDDVRVLGARKMVAGNVHIYLWGVEDAEGQNSILKLKARAALDKEIGGKSINCTLKKRYSDHIVAQCVNESKEDLSLYMLQQGYVTASRSDIYETIFEGPYVSAEDKAQAQGRGVWQVADNAGEDTSLKTSKNFLMASILLLVTGVVGLAFISFYIMRGFHRVVDVQNKTMDLAVKERHLKDKERFIIASMLDSEIRENKSKIDAYLVVYEEVLRDMNDPARTPKYKKSGDIIQKQPALGRSVFDGNTNRLDLMGEFLSSDIIHYYARIKTVPDYVDLEPDTEINEARDIVEKAVYQAKKLNELSDALIKKFVSSGLIKRG